MDHQARQIVLKMQSLERDVQAFARQARLLHTTPGLDGRLLLGECNSLIRDLTAAVKQFQGASGQGQSVRRSLSSRPPTSSGVGKYSYSGPPPRAVWGAEIRAAEKRFRGAIEEAEQEIRKLNIVALTDLNRPDRTDTAPSNLVELMVVFIQLLTKLLESDNQNRT